MVAVKPFRLGVVEGFFGKSWSWEARTQYALGLDEYLVQVDERLGAAFVVVD